MIQHEYIYIDICTYACFSQRLEFPHVFPQFCCSGKAHGGSGLRTGRAQRSATGQKTTSDIPDSHCGHPNNYATTVIHGLETGYAMWYFIAK